MQFPVDIWRRSAPTRSLSLLLLAFGCGPKSEETPDEASATQGSTATSDDPTPTDPGSPTTGGTGGSADATGTADTADTFDTADTTGTDPPGACPGDPPLVCDVALDDCGLDLDRDGVVFACDNAPDHINPDQADLDKDGFGDISDLCPTIATDNNKADTDLDGIGDACDVCARKPAHYNAGAVDVPTFMQVRNIPQQSDSDRDGIGDACDNCVRTPNCQNFGDGPGQVPFSVGMEIDDEAADCQVDEGEDLVGDACAGTMLAGAAGPVGLGNADDFDQDGLINLVDRCPRQPVPPQACTGIQDCPAFAACSDGVCNHADQDHDNVGDICDSCPDHANPKQVQDGGAQQDDLDGDFIGNVCESSAPCFERPDPRPHGFYDLQVNGYCCVTTYDGAPIFGPDGEQLDPDTIKPRRPGVFDLPAGCTAEAKPIDRCDLDDPGVLYESFCLLPIRDQEYDGVGDACDLCPFAFDPGQEPFVDDDDQEFPNHGKFCNGAFDPELADPAMMCRPGT